MTVIGTEVLAVDSLSALYRAIVRIGFPRYLGSFVTLKFGEKKPFTGFTQNGQLELVYHENPLLRAGCFRSWRFSNLAGRTNWDEVKTWRTEARERLKATGLWPAIFNFWQQAFHQINPLVGSRLRFLRVQKWEERHAE
jgi:hypothetical protein